MSQTTIPAWRRPASRTPIQAARPRPGPGSAPRRRRAPTTSRLRIACASGCFTSSVRLSLERLVHTKCDASPRTRSSYPRAKSPTPGRSILMTRAPRSASCRVANGAAIACSSATTVMPASGLTGPPSALSRFGAIRPWGVASLSHLRRSGFGVSAAYARAATCPSGLASAFGRGRLARQGPSVSCARAFPQDRRRRHREVSLVIAGPQLDRRPVVLRLPADEERMQIEERP